MLKIVFFALGINSIFSTRLINISPFKHDIVRVRKESELLLPGNKNAVLDFIGLVERHGYRAEEHRVTTLDGYILTFHRITGGPLNPATGWPKPVVFVMHGLLMSSDNFVLLGPGIDLPYLLVDAGYDVWLGNARGNTYSRSHVTLSPKDKQFWDYSYHEIGLYDLTAKIDYILEVTRQPCIIYIGFSMGTSEVFTLLSTRPEYNRKIKLVVALAPIVNWKDPLPSLLQTIKKRIKILEELVKKHGLYEIMPQSTFMGKIGKRLCNSKKKLKFNMCTKVFGEILPVSDVKTFNTSAYSTIMTYFPAGTSLKSLIHYLQNMNSHDFRPYEDEERVNHLGYRGEKPSVYSLSRVSTRVAIFYGNNDYFAQNECVEMLPKQLPNVVKFRKVPYKNFNHLDFIWSKFGKILLYDEIIALIDKYKYQSCFY